MILLLPNNKTLRKQPMKNERGFIDSDLAALIVIAMLIIILVWLVVAAISSDRKAKADFMAECMEDRKQYECTAMWRAASRF